MENTAVKTDKLLADGGPLPLNIGQSKIPTVERKFLWENVKRSQYILVLIGFWTSGSFPEDWHLKKLDLDETEEQESKEEGV